MYALFSPSSSQSGRVGKTLGTRVLHRQRWGLSILGLTLPPAALRLLRLWLSGMLLMLHQTQTSSWQACCSFFWKKINAYRQSLIYEIIYCKLLCIEILFALINFVFHRWWNSILFRFFWSDQKCKNFIPIWRKKIYRQKMSIFTNKQANFCLRWTVLLIWSKNYIFKFMSSRGTFLVKI